MNLSGGTFNNAGVLNIGALNVSLADGGTATLGGIGAVNLTGTGGLTKTTAGSAGATLTIDGGKVLTKGNGTFTEMGYGFNNTAGAAATVALANGSSIVNAGTWTLSYANVSAGAATAPVSISNSGTLTTGTTAGNWGGLGTAGSINVGLTNTGIVNGTVGTLTLNGMGAYTHSGTFNTANGRCDQLCGGHAHLHCHIRAGRFRHPDRRSGHGEYAHHAAARSRRASLAGFPSAHCPSPATW